MDLIPVANPGAQYGAHQQEIDEAVRRVLRSGRYVLGDELAAFEKEFAESLGVAHCVGVASGTDALALSLVALGVGPGDEVITVSHTAVATVAAIEQIGAIPALADIDPESYCMDPASARSLIREQTRVLMPVHIYGHPAPMEELTLLANENGLAVVEDCAQAHGTLYRTQAAGSFGALAAFSFYPTKNLGALGDAGAVVTSDASCARRIMELRQYGWKEGRSSEIPGFNSRLDEIQAAILRTKLPMLEDWIQRRGRIAEQYRQACDGGSIKAPIEPSEGRHSYHLFVVTCTDREALREHLNKRGVGTALHYPKAVHQQPAYSQRIRRDGDLVETEHLVNTMLTLPLYPELRDEQVESVCSALIDFRENGG